MAEITLRVKRECAAPPERVLAAARDFSERREKFWPNVSAKRLEVHELGEGGAEATEGTLVFPAGVWWERCRYDWSRPGIVTAEVRDSNVYVPGASMFSLAAAPRDGGSEVVMTLRREFRRTPRGFAAQLLYRVGNRWLFGSMLRDVLRAVERDGEGASA